MNSWIFDIEMNTTQGNYDQIHCDIHQNHLICIDRLSVILLDFLPLKIPTSSN